MDMEILGVIQCEALVRTVWTVRREERRRVEYGVWSGVEWRGVEWSAAKCSSKSGVESRQGVIRGSSCEDGVVCWAPLKDRGAHDLLLWVCPSSEREDAIHVLETLWVEVSETSVWPAAVSMVCAGRYPHKLVDADVPQRLECDIRREALVSSGAIFVIDAVHGAQAASITRTDGATLGEDITAVSRGLAQQRAGRERSVDLTDASQVKSGEVASLQDQASQVKANPWIQRMRTRGPPGSDTALHGQPNPNDKHNHGRNPNPNPDPNHHNHHNRSPGTYSRPSGQRSGPCMASALTFRKLLA